MSLLSGLRSEFSELKYNILKSKNMPLYAEVICMAKKEISAGKLYDVPKAKRVALVEETKENVLVVQNGSIAHANTFTQVCYNNQGKRAPPKYQKCGKIGHLDKWCRNCEHCDKKGHPKEKYWELHPYLKPKYLPSKPNTQEAKHATESNPTSNLLEELAKLLNSHKASMSHN
ncbi:hypothetical protein ACH5RR_037267 [Cinchona calisaya]|uniref:CCHC-type domain-containing protein n=1 Tax=Cinchona calisaya TaxID=153742 RepID=A0ABD2YB50_9GENT